MFTTGSLLRSYTAVFYMCIEDKRKADSRKACMTMTDQ